MKLKLALLFATLAAAQAANVDLNAASSGFYAETGSNTKSGFYAGWCSVCAGGPSEARAYFVFDLTNVTTAITSATLKLPLSTASGYSSPDPTETYTLFDASTPIDTLTGNGGVAAYNDIGAGNSYGSVNVTSANQGAVVTVTLNADGLAYLNNALSGKAAFGAAITTLAKGAQNEFLFNNSASSTAVMSLVTGDAPPPPVISLVANSQGESPTIAPNTWIMIKGTNLAPPGNTRIWLGSDFVGSVMPTALDQVSVTVNGKAAYVYYISPSQVNILTPPDAISGPVQVMVTVKGVSSASFTAQAAALSPSWFVYPSAHVIAVHLNSSLVGPTSFSVPGYPYTPAARGETIVIFANGFGPSSVPVVTGASTQSGTLSPTPVVTIGGIPATVGFAGLISPGLFQFNVTVPPNTPAGDQSIVATFNNLTTQAGTKLTVAP